MVDEHVSSKIKDNVSSNAAPEAEFVKEFIDEPLAPPDES